MFKFKKAVNLLIKYTTYIVLFSTLLYMLYYVVAISYVLLSKGDYISFGSVFGGYLGILHIN